MADLRQTPQQPSLEGMDQAARQALAQVQSGMHIGLGTGRAAEAFIRQLGQQVSAGLAVVAVTTSVRSETLAASLGIPLSTIDDVERLDIAFDGADEITPDLQLTKGLGGALLRERVVAYLAERFVILATPEKRVTQLGERAPIPVEVVPFALPVVVRAMRLMAIRPEPRQLDSARFVTDNGNFIVDAHITPGRAAAELDRAIRAIPGVVDTGLFLDMADEVLIGSEDGVTRLQRAPRQSC